jgi:Family of unknown function (DUF6524)
MNLLRRLNPRYSIWALFIYAALLVLGTYNPTRISVWHWLTQAQDWPRMWPVYMVTGLVVVGLWILFLTSVRKSLSYSGIALITVIVALLAYIPLHFNAMTASSSSITWLVLWGLIVVIGFGGSFARIRFRLFGHRSVDAVQGDTIHVEEMAEH